MARVRLNETADLPESHRWIFERMEGRGATVLNIFRALSHSPEAMRRFMKFGSYFLEEGKLDPKLRELAILRAGALCRSPYEFSQHIPFGKRAGLTESQVRGVLDPHHGLFDPREMAVLTFAGELTVAATVSDAAWDAVAAFLSAQEMVELTMVTAYYNMVSRALNALAVDVDPPAARDIADLGVEL